METTTMTARHPRDLLAYVPYRLGYHPRDSAVVVSLRPPRSRVGLVVRVDLDDLSDVRRARPMARTVAHHLERDGAEGLVVIVYSDDVDARAREALAVLDDELGIAAPVCARWVVARTGWFDPDCEDASCCPPGGHPLAELEASPLAAELVLSGVAVASSRELAYGLRRAPDADRRAARRAQSRWGERNGTAPLQPAARIEGFSQWRAAVRDVAAERPVPAPRLGRLLAALADTTVRDATLLALVPGAADLPERLVGASGNGLVACDDPTVDALTRIIGPRSEQPDQDLVGPVRELHTRLAAHASGRSSAPVLTLLGFLAWWTGDGGLARARVEAALEADEDHRLAVLLVQMLDAGLAPGWVRADAERLG